ncbi:MAG: 2-oxoacid:acceptor oxidoreductase family protein [Bacillota bacterium]
MTHEVIMAGFGGQGVMLMGQLVAYAGMHEHKNVTWLPSYGPEMRGGTANCTVVVSDEEVASPVVVDPTCAVVMNIQSYDKFEPLVRPGGILLINSSLIDKVSTRTDITQYQIPVNEIADEIGNNKVANMVMLGAFIEATRAVSLGSIVESLKKVLPARRHNLIPVNQRALERGAVLVK